MDDLLGTEAASAHIRVAPETLRRMTRRHEINFLKRRGWRGYKYRVSDLDAWLNDGLQTKENKENDDPTDDPTDTAHDPLTAAE